MDATNAWRSIDVTYKHKYMMQCGDSCDIYEFTYNSPAPLKRVPLKKPFPGLRWAHARKCCCATVSGWLGISRRNG